ncbi:hypothetical protein B5S33_g1286 [[Candida] boidinii]|nr:hypothetical protein B5S30_g1698 [[Candida] boidinii]OWB82658.1 hypothetical protein B5S33_g1286 [[Candida] boidinii]
MFRSLNNLLWRSNPSPSFSPSPSITILNNIRRLSYKKNLQFHTQPKIVSTLLINNKITNNSNLNSIFSNKRLFSSSLLSYNNNHNHNHRKLYNKVTDIDSNKNKKNDILKDENKSPQQPTTIKDSIASAAVSAYSSRREFLSQGRNFLHRTSLRLKWFLIRQNRPFNIDEVSAIISWILMGNLLWIIIGTTTFVGLMIYLCDFILGTETLKNSKLFKLFLKNLVTFDNNMQMNFNHENFKSSYENGMIKFNNLILSNNDENSNKTEFNIHIDTVKLTLSFRKWYEGKGLIKDVDILGLHGDIYSNDYFTISEDVTKNSFGENYEFNKVSIHDSKLILHNKDLNNSNNNNNNNSESEINDSNNTTSDITSSKPIEVLIFSCDMNKLRRNWLAYDFFNSNQCTGAINGSLFTIHKRQYQLAHFNALESFDFENNSNQSYNNNVINYDNSAIINNGINNNNNKNKNKNKSATDDNLNSNNNIDINESFKKISRIRVDSLDLSLINKNSKFNWIQSGKVEIIADIMFPNEDIESSNDDIIMISSASDNSTRPLFTKSTNLNSSDDFNANNNKSPIVEKDYFDRFVERSQLFFNSTLNKIFSAIDEFNSSDYSISNLPSSELTTTTNTSSSSSSSVNEINKYVVIDLKIQFQDLKANYPDNLPCSSLNKVPYVSQKDLNSLITFINDKKFGFGSSNSFDDNTNTDHPHNYGTLMDKDLDENPFDGSDLEWLADNTLSNTSTFQNLPVQFQSHYTIPPIKFRIVKNLKELEKLDILSLLTLSDYNQPNELNEILKEFKDKNQILFNNDYYNLNNTNEFINSDLFKKYQSYFNTNNLIDSIMIEILSTMVIYKEELQDLIIHTYTKRSNFDILFNNFMLGNLLIVGLGAFVI